MTVRGKPTTSAVLVTGVAALVLVSGILFQQRTRVIEGTWIDLFEGSSFFENEDTASACGPDFHNAPHFAFHPKPGTTEYGLVQANRKTLEDGAGVFVSQHGVWPVAAYSVKFVGRRQLLGFGFGHLSGHPSEYVVERVISIKPIPLTECDVRPA
jgi:hypothetical protein